MTTPATKTSWSPQYEVIYAFALRGYSSEQVLQDSTFLQGIISSGACASIQAGIGIQANFILLAAIRNGSVRHVTPSFGASTRLACPVLTSTLADVDTSIDVLAQRQLQTLAVARTSELIVAAVSVTTTSSAVGGDELAETFLIARAVYAELASAAVASNDMESSAVYTPMLYNASLAQSPVAAALRHLLAVTFNASSSDATLQHEWTSARNAWPTTHSINTAHARAWSLYQSREMVLAAVACAQSSACSVRFPDAVTLSALGKPLVRRITDANRFDIGLLDDATVSTLVTGFGGPPSPSPAQAAGPSSSSSSLWIIIVSVLVGATVLGLVAAVFLLRRGTRNNDSEQALFSLFGSAPRTDAHTVGDSMRGNAAFGLRGRARAQHDAIGLPKVPSRRGLFVNPVLGTRKSQRKLQALFGRDHDAIGLRSSSDAADLRVPVTNAVSITEPFQGAFMNPALAKKAEEAAARAAAERARLASPLASLQIGADQAVLDASADFKSGNPVLRYTASKRSIITVGASKAGAQPGRGGLGTHANPLASVRALPTATAVIPGGKRLGSKRAIVAAGLKFATAAGGTAALRTALRPRRRAAPCDSDNDDDGSNSMPTVQITGGTDVEAGPISPGAAVERRSVPRARLAVDDERGRSHPRLAAFDMSASVRGHDRMCAGPTVTKRGNRRGSVDKSDSDSASDDHVDESAEVQESRSGAVSSRTGRRRSLLAAPAAPGPSAAGTQRQAQKSLQRQPSVMARVGFSGQKARGTVMSVMQTYKAAAAHPLSVGKGARGRKGTRRDDGKGGASEAKSSGEDGSGSGEDLSG